jgi:hypothetical protein
MGEELHSSIAIEEHYGIKNCCKAHVIHEKPCIDVGEQDSLVMLGKPVTRTPLIL